jgi:hypothetical protein
MPSSNKKGWLCDNCETQNDFNSVKCVVCDADRETERTAAAEASVMHGDPVGTKKPRAAPGMMHVVLLLIGLVVLPLVWNNREQIQVVVTQLISTVLYPAVERGRSEVSVGVEKSVQEAARRRVQVEEAAGEAAARRAREQAAARRRLEEEERRRRSITFRIRGNHSNTMIVAFYSPDGRHGWPGGDRGGILNGYKITNYDVQEYRLNCTPGGRICFGAWVYGRAGGIYWGCGPGCHKGCSNCCYACGSETPVIDLNP